MEGKFRRIAVGADKRANQMSRASGQTWGGPFFACVSAIPSIERPRFLGRLDCGCLITQVSGRPMSCGYCGILGGVYLIFPRDFLEV
jgi:hypothetical protein